MRPDLLGVLEESQRRGFLGPGAVQQHIDHAAAFVAALPEAGPATVLDLGSGGGVPGLVVALAWPHARVVLLDRELRRVDHLRAAIGVLGLGDRVRAQHGRAEDAGREPELRGAFEVVTARSFAAPAVTAECAAPFLVVHGVVLVAEPPDAPDGRWPEAGLAELGLADRGTGRAGGATVRRLEAVSRCPERYPRRPGVPMRRPLF